MKRFLAAALLVTAFGAVTTPAAPASACINSMERFDDDPEVVLVEDAWAAIAAGNYAHAIEKVTGQWEDFAPGKLDPAKANAHTPVERRALRALAVAHIRAKHKQHYDWAQDVLSTLSEEGKGSDAASAHYAEALIANGKASEGRILLEEVAKRNGISDAHGWRVLSELRKADGDKAGADDALAKAGSMQKKGDAKPRKARSKKRSHQKTRSFEVKN